MTHAFLCLGLIVLAAGGQPKEASWRYTLGPVADAVADVVPLTVTDARPRWERFATDGDVCVIPLEQFDGSPGRWLHNELQRGLAALRKRPARLHLHLTSFRTLINDSTVMNAARVERNCDIIGQALEDADNPASGFLSGCFGAGLYSLFEDGPRNVSEFIGRHVRRVRPPATVGRDAPGDVSCEIQAILVIVAPDETKRQVPVRFVCESGPPADDNSPYRGGLVQEVVRAASVGFARRIVKECQPPKGVPPSK